MKDLTKFTETLDEYVKEVFDIDTDEVVVAYEDGSIYSSLFAINIDEIEMDEDSDELTEVAFISFNDSVNTSYLIRVALAIIPYIEDGLEMDVLVDNCHWTKLDKEGVVVDIIDEGSYTKECKVKKVKKEK